MQVSETDNLYKVGHGGALGNDLTRIGHSVENLKVSVELVVQFQDTGHVAAAVAIVGRRPHGDEVLAGEHVLVSLLHQLVGSANKLQAVHPAELVRDL